MAGASAQQGDIEVTFEAYVKKGGRWLVVDVVRDRLSALKLGQELAEHKDHEAVKVVRDELNLRSGRNVEVVVFDSEIKIERRPTTPQAKPAQPKRPPPPAPEVRRPAVEPKKRGFPWIALVSTVLGLTFAALGFWFIDAIY